MKIEVELTETENNTFKMVLIEDGESYAVETKAYDPSDVESTRNALHQLMQVVSYSIQKRFKPEHTTKFKQVTTEQGVYYIPDGYCA